MMSRSLHLGILSIFLFLFSWRSFADEDAHKLNQIKHTIQFLKTDLHKTVRRQTDLEANLKKTELRIEKINRRLVLNASFQSKQQKILDQLKLKQQQYENSLNVHRALLAEELASAYKLGQADYLKVLLSQENPEILDRMLMYQGYFSKKREKAMLAHQTQLTQLEENQAHMDYVGKKLQEMDQKLNEEREALQKALLDRQHILKELHLQIGEPSSQLKRLLGDQADLEGIINDVIIEKDIWSGGEVENHFRNRLPWPIRGKIILQFGSPVEHSTLKSNGVLIAAPKGQMVHAIASGQIVFSKWLRGYGLLTIINHGKGFMSLYGHNNRLFKGEGAAVRAREVIAEVGQISGYDESGLYFEVRQNGVALDPGHWCE